MSNLSAFLNPATLEITKELTVSDRFLDEDGKPAKIIIKAITQDENERLIKLSTRTTKDRGQVIENLNRREYQARLIISCSVEPDFSQMELCAAYGVVDPLEVPGKMFLAGEYAKLVRAIMDINGFRDVEELDEGAKNS